MLGPYSGHDRSGIRLAYSRRWFEVAGEGRIRDARIGNVLGIKGRNEKAAFREVM